MIGADAPLFGVVGDKFEQPFIFRNVNFTNCKAKMQIRYRQAPYPILHTLTTENDGINIDVTSEVVDSQTIWTSTLTLLIPDTITVNFFPQPYKYALDIIWPVTNVPEQWFDSTIIFSPNGTT